MTQLHNHLIVPPHLYKLVSDAHTVKAAYELADNTILAIDKEGHIHEFKYIGRIIDRPPVTLIDLHEDD